MAHTVTPETLPSRSLSTFYSFPSTYIDHLFSDIMSSQQQFLENLESIINEEIATKLDVKSLTSSTNTFTITDLGCSTGPNTLITVNKLLESIKLKYQNQTPNDSSHLLEFQVFFNDQTSNDFNTLFSLLPQENKPYFAAGVPGSFHDRLFPASSIHFAYSCCAIHWLSSISGDLLDKNSPAWNRGRVHYLGGGPAVQEAYAALFAEDVERFLNGRAEEIVSGGMLVVILMGVRVDMSHWEISSTVVYDCLGSTLMDMANEGKVEEDQINSFNIPIYYPTSQELQALIEKNGKFNIERVEQPTLSPLLDALLCVSIIRSSMEGLFTKHFGRGIVDEMFPRFHEKLVSHVDQLQATTSTGVNILLVLKRK